MQNKSTLKKHLEIISYIIQNTADQKHVSSTDITRNCHKIDPRTLRKIIEDFNNAQDDYYIQIFETKPLTFCINSDPFYDMYITRPLLDLIYSCNFFSKYTKENFKKTLIQLTHKDQRKYLEDKISILSDYNSVENDFLYEPLENILKSQVIRKTIDFNYRKPLPNGRDKEKHYSNMIPIDLNCDNNTFYLYCFDQIDKRIKTFRLSFIQNVRIANQDYTLDDKIISDYIDIIRKQSYSFNGNRDAMLTLAFDEDIYANIIDKFGITLNPIKCDDGKYIIEQKCNISNTFYSWIVGFGGKIKIISPQPEVEAFKKMLINQFIK